MARWKSVAALSLLLMAPSLARAATREPTLHVFAAASLADAFAEMAAEFEKAHPGAVVHLNLAGSQQLVTQIEHGASADVLATADTRWMDHAREKELLGGDPEPFARNRLVVIVPRSNPARIRALPDLARRGVKVVIGAEAVPVGAYSHQLLQNLSRSPGFPPDFARRVLANVVSEEENAKSVVGKVQLGEADAGIVYTSDVTPAMERFVRRFPPPEEANVVATYPIAVVRGARRAEDAQSFVALVLSPRGQAILTRRGLLPASTTP